MLKESPLYGVPIETIARACGVHVDTARRWKRNGCAPETAMRLVRLLCDADLGTVSQRWCGWYLRHDELVSAQGDRFTPGIILASKYHRQRAAELERELQQPRQLCL